jgi:tRNA (guanine-N7-)-methyltransferase
MGETTAAIARARPDVNFLGIEVHTPGVGALMKQIVQEGLSNVRIIQHDAVEVLEHMIAPSSLAGIHIFFPDPWHKARHHKRRLIQPPFIRRVVDHLAPDGYIHCATDWEEYAVQMLAVLEGEPGLSNFADGYATAVNPLVERPRTKFEARGLRLGHGVWDLVFRRRD